MKACLSARGNNPCATIAVRDPCPKSLVLILEPASSNPENAQGALTILPETTRERPERPSNLPMQPHVGRRGACLDSKHGPGAAQSAVAASGPCPCPWRGRSSRTAASLAGAGGTQRLQKRWNFPPLVRIILTFSKIWLWLVEPPRL